MVKSREISEDETWPIYAMSKEKNETVSCGRDLGCVPNIESSLNCVSQQGLAINSTIN